MSTQTIRIEMSPVPVAVDLSNKPVTMAISGAVVSGVDLFRVTMMAAGALSALRVVKKLSTGYLAVCDGNTAADAGTALGVSLTAVGAGGGGVTVRTHGRMSDDTWSWTPGQPVYCGVSGALTQNSSVATAFVQQIGIADSATSIIISIQDSVTKG